MVVHDDTVIHVVVSGSGGAGFGEPGDRWAYGAAIAAWMREPDFELRRDRLYLRKHGLTREELREWMASMSGFARVRVRVAAAPAPARTRLEAEIIAILGPSERPELQAVVAELTAPVRFDDSELGRFELDRQMDWFEGQTSWLGATARVRVNVETIDAATATLAAARSIFTDRAGWDTRLRACAIENLLDLKNGTWSDGGEPTTPKAFADRLTLASVVLDADGAFTFYFDDGYLFDGHVVVVHGDLAHGPRYAKIEG